MKVIFAVYFLCLFTIYIQGAPEPLPELLVKEYVIKIQSNLDIKSIDIKGEPLKESGTDETVPPTPQPVPHVTAAATAPPTAPPHLSHPSPVVLPTTIAPVNKTATEEADDDDK